jgi:hypothetical protein
MAIDTSVITQVNPPSNPLAMVGQYASAAANLQNVQNQKAALPGIMADTAIKQRAANFNKWLTDNASTYIKPEVGADGKPTPGGYHNVDTSGLVSAAANAGYVTEAQSIAANDLKNQSTNLQNGLTAATTQQTQALTNGTNITNANNAATLAIYSRGYVSTMMDAYQKANPTGGDNGMWDKEYNKLVNGVQDQYGKALNVHSVFGTPDVLQTDAQGKPVMGQDGKPVMTYKYDPVENNAMRTATQSPQVQQELANSKELIAQAGATGMNGANWRKLDSDETRNAQKIAIASNPTMADTYSQMTGAQLAAIPGIKETILANVNPQGARSTAVTNMYQQVNDAKQYDSAANKLDALKAKLSPQDQAQFQASPIAWLQTNAARFAGVPEFTDAQSALGNVNQTHPELKLGSMDAGSLAVALRGQRDNSLNLAGTSGAIATAPSITGAAQGVATQGGKPNATPTNPGGNGSVKMVDTKGKSYTIPANKVAAAKADGLKVAQ